MYVCNLSSLYMNFLVPEPLPGENTIHSLLCKKASKVWLHVVEI